jgi:hypothetical protein
MASIIATILNSEHFSNRPPVLIDIGASGEINAKWKAIAPHAICIAFDADDREFNVSASTSSGYKKLITINRIVSATPMSQAAFYLTASPFCSSLLQPAFDKLSPWSFQSLFTTNKKIELPATTLAEALQEAGIDYIDWFKTDTQGTDLRLFLSVPNAIKDTILAAELEPGILDAYEDEDKLYRILEVLPQHQFWLSSMEVKGTQRLKETYVPQAGKLTASRGLRKSPGWAELCFLKQPLFKSKRELLLLYVFALIEKQYGFAIEVMDAALQQYDDAIFEQCRREAFALLKKQQWKIPFVMVKKQLQKLYNKLGIADYSAG